MLSNRKSNQKGFTIIEVLIVLAIAGLILLIVFLAVPALQRTSRNTARKTDVGRVGSAVTEQIANNNGAVFTGSNAELDGVIASAGTLSQYTLVRSAAIGANSLSYATGTQLAIPAGVGNANLGSIVIVRGATCAAAGATATNTSNRRLVLQYLTETSGAPAGVCQEI